MDLFDRLKKPEAPAPVASAASAPAPSAPLAERMRPRTLEELVGHSALLGPRTPLGRAILADRAPSMLLWGPPGCGKTTVAKVVAAHSAGRFVLLSAVLAGVAELRAAVAQAEAERRAGKKTLLFVDEIHRFNKAQQDALLPHVEAGTVTLLGATTDNPSFAVVAALLSRCQVVRLEPLAPEPLSEVLERALEDAERGLGATGVRLTREQLLALAEHADGDARKALGTLEHVVGELAARGAKEATEEDLRSALRARALRYDKDGEEHYNLASALIKSLRGSDPDAALYWALRMIEAGDDPLFVLRRLLIFAAEDIGLADPRALEVAVAADQAFARLGVPEGMIPLSQAVLYLAVAPKSKATYKALGAAKEEVARSGALPVPLRLRNAPTRAMKEWGYGKGYRDPQAEESGTVPERYLPEALGDRVFYEPTTRGQEARIGEHLARLRAAAAKSEGK